ncbi:4Fe-4S binding protein [Colwellia psychrerythraea]|uniref:Nitrous oxide expression regulator, NosR n=1 Tax=Colwellia psychrerythraea TaxID=28229 RepID=A0A099KWG5_COLPS|nr:4Fe-4S binding protein [Colwellia psychrerythraea]KGJ94177.1 nitrous oxide expression regulator, NosR [Colwellia psychrerythraea]
MPFKHLKNLKTWALFTLLLMLTTSFYSAAFNTTTHANVTAISDDVAQLFPSATRVGPMDKNIAVTPVYQLNELLGYVFESDDFVNFIGFSGQTINLLIGIDTQGVFTGLKILDHNEPIFLHGLGEQSMFKFIKQYQGHSIKERFIVNARSKTANDIAYIDGVTRATISVLVINDTITASALKVARERLSGFVAPSQVSINADYFQAMNFTELLDRNFITHWQLNREQALATTQTSPTNLANEIQQLTEEGEDFIDLYFAFVNIPIIGKNLLGEEEYQRLLDSLKPGEHALMMFGSGQYDFVSEDFIPQTVPNRLSAQQATLPVDIRDIDFYSFSDPSFALTVPDFNDIKVFRIKSQSGFELNKEFSLSLMVSYNKSFLSQQQHSFSINNTLPENLFIQNTPEINAEENRPLWLKIWISRSTDIIILSSYLIFLVGLFIKQATLAQNADTTHKIRFISLAFVIGFIGFYAQGQLSVVNIYTLLLSLWQGFNIDVFLLDPIIFILWVFVFISLFLWGRGLFCGWLCPFGALQEFAALIASKLKIKQIKIKPQHHKAAQKIKYAVLIILVGCSFYSLTLAEQLAEIEPFKTSITLNFVRYWPFVLYVVLILALSLKIHKVYCRYLCPLGAGLAIIGRYPLFKWLTRRQECGSPCQLCRNKKCGIDAINKDGSVDYGECIQCLECLVTIKSPKECVVDKYSKKRKAKVVVVTPHTDYINQLEQKQC